MIAGESSLVYVMLYLCGNMLTIYTAFRYARLFFGKSYAGRRIEFMAFLGYFLVNSLGFLVVRNLRVNILTNLLCYFGTTFLYRSSFYQKLLAVLIVYGTNICVDSIIGAVFFPTSCYLLTAGCASAVGVRLIEWGVERLSCIKNHCGFHLPEKGKTMMIIPFISVPLAAMNYTHGFEDPLTRINLVGLLIINIVTFYIYSYMLNTSKLIYQDRILKEQITAYQAKFEATEEANRQTSLLRHDMKNHISTLRSLVQKDRQEEVVSYIEAMMDRTICHDSQITTGNIDMDCILAGKIAKAEHAGVQLHLEIQIPVKLKIEPFSLNVIIGNLLDNAIEAVKDQEQKEVYCEVKYRNDICLIHVSNPYTGARQRQGAVFKTTKSDKELHGYGLESVRNVVEQHHGSMDVSDDDQQFVVDILLYKQSM